MNVGERVEVRARWAGGRLREASVGLSPPVPVARLLGGLTPEEALPLIPALFPVCGSSHQAAATLCLRRAAGAPSPSREEIRELEARILLDDAMTALFSLFLLADPSDRTVLASLRGSLSTPGLFPEAKEKGWAREMDRRATLLEDRLVEWMLGGPADDFLGLDPDALLTYASESSALAGRLLRRFPLGPAPEGTATTGFLPPLAPDSERAYAGGSGEEGFWEAPYFEGRVVETGPLARRVGEQGFAPLFRRWGAGPFLRRVARLQEIAGLPAAFRRLARDGTGGRMACYSGGPDEGVAVVEVGRGRLFHRARVEAGRIADYRIGSPTRWNFHPGGVLSESLLGLSGSSVGEARIRVRDQIESLDPCAAVSIDISHA